MSRRERAGIRFDTRVGGQTRSIEDYFSEA